MAVISIYLSICHSCTLPSVSWVTLKTLCVCFRVGELEIMKINLIKLRSRCSFERFWKSFQKQNMIETMT